MRDEDTQPAAGAPGLDDSTSYVRMHRWGRWEGRFESREAYGDPVHTVEMRVALVAPSGARHTGLYLAHPSVRVDYKAPMPDLLPGSGTCSANVSGRLRYEPRGAPIGSPLTNTVRLDQ
jgi:hypothetical protein